MLPNPEPIKIASVEINFSHPNTRPVIEYFRTDRNLEIEKAYKLTLQKNEKLLSWKAVDIDRDQLSFQLFYKSVGDDAKWLELEKEITTSYLILNGLAFPSGDYEFKLVVSDEKSNDPKNAYRIEKISSLLSIDNDPPILSAFTVFEDRVEFSLRDENSVIDKLSYSIDKKTFKMLYPVDAVYDDQEERFVINQTKTVKEIIIHGEDRMGNVFLKTLNLKQ